MMHSRKRARLGKNTAREDLDLKEDWWEMPTVEVVSGSVVSGSVVSGSTSATTIRPISPQKGKCAWTAEGTSWTPEDRTDFGLDTTPKEYEDALLGPIYEDGWEDFDGRVNQEAESMPKRRSIRAIRPHQYWRLHSQDAFLDELIRHKGRGDSLGQDGCTECWFRKEATQGEPKYRCRDCYGGELICKKCCLRRHQINPFHCVQEWDGERFVSVTLKALGLRIQLNHRSNRCTMPVDCHKSLRILHRSGIHEVNLKFCGCEQRIDQHLQLLCRGLYPASQGTGKIRTVATFAYLELLHHLILTTKSSTYHVYQTLSKMTDATGVSTPPWRYHALMRMTLQWRHLKLLKCSGRGHEPSGVAGTRDGELVVQCPSCPYPGVNLPEGWEKDKENEDLYVFRAAQDANFRLREQLVSSHSRDPGLNDGKGYFVRREPYEDYVGSQASDEDFSTCVGFQAIIKATTRHSKGLRYTGVAAVGCARSEMWLPNGAANMQRGERYPNLDYPFASVIKLFWELFFVIIAYDIVCQWFINLPTRIKKWPVHLRPPKSLQIIPVIGKFHEPAHKVKDHEKYSANLLKWMGTIDWELLERLWGAHNPLGNATKTMGPGTRIDTLEAHFGEHNWLKYIGHGETLWKKYRTTIRDRNRQREAHASFTQSLPSDLVKKWDTACKAWEDAPWPKKNIENPFERREDDYMSQKQVEAELAAEDEARRKAEQQVVHKTSAAKFIKHGLDLEDSQIKLLADIKSYKGGNKEETRTQGAGILDRRTVMRRTLRGFEELQGVYMPGLLQLLTELGEARSKDDDGDPEESKLWLPSAVEGARRRSVCSPELVDMEARLRRARCFDALSGLRHTLRVKTGMVQFKQLNVRGQRDSARSRDVIDRVHERAKDFAEKYRRNRAALKSMIGKGDWERQLRELRNEDVRSYVDPQRRKLGPGRRGTNEEEPGMEGVPVVEKEVDGNGPLDLHEEARECRDGTGETRKEISWIWLTHPVKVTDGVDEDHDILRSEWCRSRARAHRSEEELRYDQDDMRRTEQYLEWRRNWWKDRRRMRSVRDGALKEGLKAYATEQAFLQRALKNKFVDLWRGQLKEGQDYDEGADEHRLRMDLGMGVIEDEDDDGANSDEGLDCASGGVEVEEPDTYGSEDFGWA